MAAKGVREAVVSKPLRASLQKYKKCVCVFVLHYKFNESISTPNISRELVVLKQKTKKTTYRFILFTIPTITYNKRIVIPIILTLIHKVAGRLHHIFPNIEQNIEQNIREQRFSLSCKVDCVFFFNCELI